jgi:hypothetical protein
MSGEISGAAILRRRADRLLGSLVTSRRVSWTQASPSATSPIKTYDVETSVHPAGGASADEKAGFSMSFGRYE